MAEATSASAAKNGVRFRMLMDAGQMGNPSCAPQLSTVAQFMALTGKTSEFRQLRQKSSGFSSLHAKTWLLDEEPYLGGSFNFTKNRAVSNEEHVVLIKVDRDIEVRKLWFWDLWRHSQSVVLQEVQGRMLQKARAMEQKMSQSAMR
jgi:hypothetical protein